MKNQLTVGFETLTPIWTGGADQDGRNVKETGIVGSLRYWYEGIVRGLRGNPCGIGDGDSVGTCRLEPEKYKEGLARGMRGAGLLASSGLCPVCQLFGATGWRRRFRLVIEGLEPHPLSFSASPNIYGPAGFWLWRMFGADEAGGTKSGRGTQAKFTFGRQCLWGRNARMRFTAADVLDHPALSRLLAMLDVIAQYGAIGSKAQNGFGLIRLTDDRDSALIDQGRKLIAEDVKIAPGDTRALSQSQAFNLRAFFSRTYAIPSQHGYFKNLLDIGTPSPTDSGRLKPCAFDIRYKSQQKHPIHRTGEDVGLRPWFKQKYDRDVANQLFGNSTPKSDADRSASRIRVSHLYKVPGDDRWHLRVWGHVPRDCKLSAADVAREVDDFLRSTMFAGSPGIQLMEGEFQWEKVFKE